MKQTKAELFQLLATGTRGQIVAWLVERAPNMGRYSDAEQIEDGYAPLTLEEAREEMRGELEDMTFEELA